MRQIPITRIDTPVRPARRFLGDIASLADSMQDYGLQQPITVRAEGDRFWLTSGLRRLSAARLLGWTSIPAFVRSVGADDAYVLDLVENLQRQDLTPEEEADALRELVRTRGWTLQQVADSVKRSVGYVSKRVRLFDDDALRDAVTRRGLPVSTAEELLGVPAQHRSLLIERALAEAWDQGQARDAIRAAESGMLAPDVAGASNAGEPRLGRAHAAVGTVRSLGSMERPRGFTRAIREFHRLIMDVRAENLTGADRTALRSLFRDLVMLARAPTKATAPVVPPLPAQPAARGRSPRHNARRSSARPS